MQAARIADIPWTIGAGLAEIGFTFESFTSRASTLRCSCGWGRLVCIMMQFSHAPGRGAGQWHDLQGTLCENLVTFPQPLGSTSAMGIFQGDRSVEPMIADRMSGSPASPGCGKLGAMVAG